MHHQIHLMIVTSLSMIITFGLYSIMEHVPSRHSFLRILWIDQYHDYALLIQCPFNRGFTDKTCFYIINRDHLSDYIIHWVVFELIFLLSIFYGSKLDSHICSMLLTLLTVEFLAEYVDSFDSYYKIDALTVYLLVWQLCSLLFNWTRFEFLSPILVIEQGSFCLLAALLAWIIHYIYLRYIQLNFIMISFWFFSVIDTFNCLHCRGRLYRKWMMNRTIAPRKNGFPGVYYVNGVDKYQNSASLGFGDFLFYDLLVLLTIPQSSSMTLKVCVAFGSIISVQLGRLLTHLLRCLVKVRLVPGVPLPFITVSIYLFLLDIIMSNSNQCIKL